jgi:3-dehydroquinate synthase
MGAVEKLELIGERGLCEVVVELGCLNGLGTLLDDLGVERPRSVVSNVTVGPLHGRRAAVAAGCAEAVELPDGEAHKRWSEVERLLRRWLADALHRGQSVMAVGGGVVTDTVGFAAAVYLRGVPWLAVPTTLLAMVDAAIGGKTGVNLDEGKNLVGSFWAPRLVVVDVTTLATLPERELRAGMAEVVKAAWIGDHELLELLPRPLDGYGSASPEAWQELVLRAMRVKAEVVASDEREAGARRALNLGHSLGHALEAATSYERFLHGEAVAWGLEAAARLAARRGLLSVDARDRLGDAVAALGPRPPLADLDADAVLEHLARDKKRDDLGVSWVLPTDDGVVLDQRVEEGELRELFAELQGLD